MADTPDEDMLRESARHRGLKLVKSRKRTPGTGDYGRFGLTDAGGKPLFGFGEGGLTATPDEIAAYLRKGAASTWAESARITPAAKKPRASSTPVPEPADPVPAKPARRSRAAEAEPRRAPPPPAPLRVRAAGKADGDAVVGLALLTMAGARADAIKPRLKALADAGGSLLVADKGGVIGCLAWQLVATLQHGAIARISLLVVEEGRRRSGTGRALLEAALAEMAERGCTVVEVMSDIAIRNANGFFRTLGFEQTSYRFARAL